MGGATVTEAPGLSSALDKLWEKDGEAIVKAEEIHRAFHMGQIVEYKCKDQYKGLPSTWQQLHNGALLTEPHLEFRIAPPKA